MSKYGKAPAQSISFGDIGVLLGAAAMPTGPVALQSRQYETVADGDKSGVVVQTDAPYKHPTTQRQLVWRIFFSGSPSAVSLKLQGSLDDVDANYVDIPNATYTSTTSGQVKVQEEDLSVYRFWRVSVVTGGYDIYSDVACL